MSVSLVQQLGPDPSPDSLGSQAGVLTLALHVYKPHITAAVDYLKVVGFVFERTS